MARLNKIAPQTDLKKTGETFCFVVALRKAGLKKRKSSVENTLVFLALLGEKHRLDVGQDASLSDGHASKKPVELLVVADSQLKMSGVDSQLLVVPGGVAGQLEDLSGQVLHDGGQIHWGSCSYTLGVVAPLEMAVDTTHWELESGTFRTTLALGTSFASFSSSRHDR